MLHSRGWLSSLVNGMLVIIASGLAGSRKDARASDSRRTDERAEQPPRACFTRSSQLLHVLRTWPGCHGSDRFGCRSTQAREAEVTVVDLLVLVPWLIFGAGMAVIGYRLLRRQSTARRYRRPSR